MSESTQKGVPGSGPAESAPEKPGMKQGAVMPVEALLPVFDAETGKTLPEKAAVPLLRRPSAAQDTGLAGAALAAFAESRETEITEIIDTGTASAPPEAPAAAEPAPVPPVLPAVPPAAVDAAPPEKPKPLSSEAVTEHTALLWKYLPVSDDQPEPAPEYLHQNVRYPGGQVIAARVRGKKHKHEGTNCDDWYETAHFGGITFAAVSDGAGSKMYARIGARVACKAAVESLANGFEKLFAEHPELSAALALPLSEPKCMEACGLLAGAVQQAVQQARAAVEAACDSRAASGAYAKALGRSLQLKDLSGTLLLAALAPVGPAAKESLVITCQIGDGMIALLNSKGPFESSLKLMGVPDSGEFSGETDFLTSPQMKELENLQRRTKISRGVFDTLLLMSDGVADDYFPNETEMRRLYFDLLVNGILEGRLPEKPGFAELTRPQLRLFKKIPDPLEYPWVNNPEIRVPIQYTNRICEAAGLTLEDLWRDPSVLNLARLELAEPGADAALRLERWLDNYVERGSFDDRTLVIITM